MRLHHQLIMALPFAVAAAVASRYVSGTFGPFDIGVALIGAALGMLFTRRAIFLDRPLWLIAMAGAAAALVSYVPSLIWLLMMDPGISLPDTTGLIETVVQFFYLLTFALAFTTWVVLPLGAAAGVLAALIYRATAPL